MRYSFTVELDQDHHKPFTYSMSESKSRDYIYRCYSPLARGCSYSIFKSTIISDACLGSFRSCTHVATNARHIDLQFSCLCLY
jgi:hypothetical protein